MDRIENLASAFEVPDRVKKGMAAALAYKKQRNISNVDSNVSVEIAQC